MDLMDRGTLASAVRRGMFVNGEDSTLKVVSAHSPGLHLCSAVRLVLSADCLLPTRPLNSWGCLRAECGYAALLLRSM